MFWQQTLDIYIVQQILKKSKDSMESLRQDDFPLSTFKILASPLTDNVYPWCVHYECVLMQTQRQIFLLSSFWDMF